VSGRARLIASWPIVLVAAVAAATGSFRLGAKSLWLDEAYSAQEASSHGSQFWTYWFHGDPNMTLYYLMLHFWTAFGTSAVALRSLSVIWFVAGAVMVFKLGDRLFGKAVGLTSGLLLCLSTFAVTYAQTARSYSLLVFLSVTASYMFIRSLESSRRAWWIGYAIFGTLGIYSHFFGMLVILSQVAYLVARRPAADVWRRIGAAWIAIAVLVAPLALHAVGHSSQISWIPHTTLGAILHVGYNITGGTALFVVFLIVIAYAILVAVQRAGSDWSWNVTFLLFAIAVPPIVTLVVSIEKPLWISYYLIECLPPIVIVVSAAAWSVRFRWATVCALAVVAGLAMYSLVGYYNGPSFENWRGAVGYGIKGFPPDGFMLAPAAFTAVEYYLGQDHRPELIGRLITEKALKHALNTPGNSTEVVVVFETRDPRESGKFPSISRVLGNAGFHLAASVRFVGAIDVVTYSRSA
jgi:mannosyltransferase